jgi:aspartate kinase
VEVRPYRIQDELEAGRVVIVAGYQGVSYKREITTLGRGGTDTTAVALAAALGAEACEIYSDVDGVYSADPRVVEDARRLEEMTYEEMQELARLGARVLNATAVEFARRAGIALFARSTHQVGSVGTKIHEGGPIHRVDGADEHALATEAGPTARAVSGLRRGLWVEGDCAHEAAEALLARVAGVDAPLCDLEDSGEGVTLRLLLNLDDVHDQEALVGELRALLGERGQIDHRGLVAAVGLGLGDRPAPLQRARQALREAGIAFGCARANGLSIKIVVPCEQVGAATQALHAALVGRAGDQG